MDPQIRTERDVEELVVKPLLRSLGWDLASSCQVRITLDADKAELWKYKGPMCRDYVLIGDSGDEVHIEAKYRWSGWKLDLDSILRRFSSEDFSGSDRDGPVKDLALLLWGVRSRGGQRAVVIDEARLAVFEWENDWAMPAMVRVDDPSFFDVARRWLARP